MDDWKITFVDTGKRRPSAIVSSRSRPHIGDDELFLATYGDGLTDAPLDEMIDRLVLERQDRPLPLRSARGSSYHVVVADEDGIVRSIEDIDAADVRINGGFFVFRSDIFDTIEPGEDIMDERRHSSIERGRAASSTVTKDSGRRWTRSRTSRSWTRSSKAAGRRGRPCREHVPRTRCSHCRLGRRRARCAAFSSSAVIPTTSRSDAAGPSSR